MARVQALPALPDVFLLDIHVSPMNGFDMLHELRCFEPTAGRMIVALTASVMNSEVHQLKQAGFDGILPKPLNFHSFPTTLDRILMGEHIWTLPS
ncbi:MAG: response regulator, partial [Chloroflexota bacterium]